MASFSTIGAAWLAHNAITEYLERADAAFVRLNLLLLLFVSFLPFPTRLVAEYIHQDKAERVAVTFYGIVLLLSSTMLLVLWRYAVRARLVRPDTADEEIELLTERLTPGLGAYLVLIVSGLFVPIIAVIGFLGIALYYIIPFRRLSASFRPASASAAGPALALGCSTGAGARMQHRRWRSDAAPALALGCSTGAGAPSQVTRWNPSSPAPRLSWVSRADRSGKDCSG